MRTVSLISSRRGRVIILMLLPVLTYVLLFSYRTVRWKTWIWLPTLVATPDAADVVPDDQKHLIFLLADHYEPGAGEAGTRAHKCAEFFL